MVFEILMPSYCHKMVLSPLLAYISVAWLLNGSAYEGMTTPIMRYFTRRVRLVMKSVLGSTSNLVRYTF